MESPWSDQGSTPRPMFHVKHLPPCPIDVRRNFQPLVTSSTAAHFIVTARDDSKAPLIAEFVVLSYVVPASFSVGEQTRALRSRYGLVLLGKPSLHTKMAASSTPFEPSQEAHSQYPPMITTSAGGRQTTRNSGRGYIRPPLNCDFYESVATGCPLSDLIQGLGGGPDGTSCILRSADAHCARDLRRWVSTNEEYFGIKMTLRKLLLRFHDLLFG